MNIILASQSPRRIELLKSIHIEFESINSNINENKYSFINQPSQYCIKLAELKASTVLSQYNDSIIIGADTIVYFDKKILGKPKDANEAYNTLKLLSNNTHFVYTGVSIKTKKYSFKFYDKTSVSFYPITNKIIKYYINHFNPFDKAGSYGIQDWSKVFIRNINGCYYNVMGLPIAKLYKSINDNKILKKLINL